jgi:hypothetical protein
MGSIPDVDADLSALIPAPTAAGSDDEARATRVWYTSRDNVNKVLAQWCHTVGNSLLYDNKI